MEHKCPKCGIQGVVLSRTKNTIDYMCWSWQCRHMWTHKKRKAKPAPAGGEAK